MTHTNLGYAGRVIAHRDATPDRHGRKLRPGRKPRRSRTHRHGAVVAALGGLLAVTLAGCSFGNPPPDQQGEPPNLPAPSLAPGMSLGPDGDGSDADVEVLAIGVPQPWAIAFLPDGSGLVTERKTGDIIEIDKSPSASGPAEPTTVGHVSGIDASGDGGLLGIAVSPKYKTDGTVYVYYTTKTDNRIASMKLGDHQGVPKVILKGIPRGATDNGGALVFGPDGDLYAATGDAGNAKGGVKAPSQEVTSLAGKILRMTPAGKPVGGASLVYARGLHDVEGLAFDGNKHLYAIDASKSADNLLLVTKNADFGWPAIGGDVAPQDRPQPIQTFPLSESTCAGIAVIANAVATACPTGKRVWISQVTARGGTLGAPTSTLEDSYGRLRAIAAASDGSFWVGTSNTDGHGKPSDEDDQILRVIVADTGVGIT